MLRNNLGPVAATLALCAAAVGSLPSAHAVGNLVDVQVVDRGTGETLTPVLYKGDWWIAGNPGARYGVTLLSRNPQRTLNVVSIDGVNAISGDTTVWNQTGYVPTCCRSPPIRSRKAAASSRIRRRVVDRRARCTIAR